jgi:hypothetical protein
MGLVVLVNAGLSGQIIVNETFSGDGTDLISVGTDWQTESIGLSTDGTWGNKAGAFYPLSSLSANTVYTITFDTLIPNTGSTAFGGLALVTESGPSPVDSVDSSSIDKAGWFMFRENGEVESRDFSTGTIDYNNFYVPGGTGGSEDTLIEVVITTGASAASSTVSLSVDGVVFDMDEDELTPTALSGVDLSSLQSIGLTGYDDHVIDTFTITVDSGTVVPPASVVVAIVGTDVQCTFDSVNGQSYQLLVSTDDLASFGPVIGASDTGDGGPLTLTHAGGVPASGQSVFYCIETN